MTLIHWSRLLQAFGATLAICGVLGGAEQGAGQEPGVLRVVREHERRDERLCHCKAGYGWVAHVQIREHQYE